MSTTIISPQPGPQTSLLSSPANIVVFGGQAGGGKSYGLMLDALRGVTLPGYSAVLFRRTYPEITMPGGLWDTAMELYPLVGGKPNVSRREFIWPNGAKIAMRAMQYVADVYRWQGGQIPYLGFDEGTHFAQQQIMYMVSRNRSMVDIAPVTRVTCNPDAGSWLASFISWWIDQDTGYPILERTGRIRWFYRKGDEFLWYAKRSEAMEANPELANDPLTGAINPPKSVTFIP